MIPWVYIQGDPKKSFWGSGGGFGCGRVGLFCPFLAIFGYFLLFLGLIRHLEPKLGIAWASLTLISIIPYSLGPLGGTEGVRGGQGESRGVQKFFLYIFWNYMKWRKIWTKILFDSPFTLKIAIFGGKLRTLAVIFGTFNGSAEKKTLGNSSVSHRLSKNAKK